MTMNIEDCVSELLIDGTQDDIGAYWVAATAAQHGATSLEDIKNVSLQIIRRLLLDGLMQIGSIEGVGFNPELPTQYERVVFLPWNLSIEAAMERVDREWTPAIKSPPFVYPEPGAVCWLVNTDKGNQVARHLIEQQDKRIGNGI